MSLLDWLIQTIPVPRGAIVGGVLLSLYIIALELRRGR